MIDNNTPLYYFTREEPDRPESKRPSGACLGLVIGWGLILIIVVAGLVLLMNWQAFA